MLSKIMLLQLWLLIMHLFYNTYNDTEKNQIYYNKENIKIK